MILIFVYSIKMCTNVNHKDLITVHHEMMHVQYFLNYRHQPKVFRDGANPGKNFTQLDLLFTFSIVLIILTTGLKLHLHTLYSIVMCAFLNGTISFPNIYFHIRCSISGIFFVLLFWFFVFVAIFQLAFCI